MHNEINIKKLNNSEELTKHGTYRKSVHELEGIFKLLKTPIKDGRKYYIVVGDDKIKFDVRYELFLRSIKCVKCGVSGKFFTKERHSNVSHYHLNLYSVKEGREVLMTKDHILPDSLGGKNTLENYQTMCADCNSKKANKLEVDNKEIAFMHMISLRPGYVKELENKIKILKSGVQKKKPTVLQKELKFAMKIDKERLIDPILMRYIDTVEKYLLIGPKKLKRIKQKIKDMKSDRDSD